MNVCHSFLLRNTWPSSDWGQQWLNGVFFHLCSSHLFVSPWLWANSHCTAGSRQYIRFNSGSGLGEKHDSHWLCKSTSKIGALKVVLQWEEHEQMRRFSLVSPPIEVCRAKRKGSLKACVNVYLRPYVIHTPLKCTALFALWSTTKSTRLHPLNSPVILHVKEALASDWLELFSLPEKTHKTP